MFPKTVFWIGAKGGLVEEKHRRRMGEAIWLFLWLLLRQTDLNQEGEGVVQYGKPVSIRTIEADTRFPRSTIQRWTDLLIQQDYVRTDKQANGTIFWILNGKSKKKRVPLTGQLEEQSVPLTGRKCPIDGTQNPSNRNILKQLSENATIISSISQNHYNKDAAAKGAAGVNFPLKTLAKAKSIPREKSPAEIEQERQRQLKALREIGRIQ